MDELVSKLEKIFKEGGVNICPECGKVTKVYPNPYYMHTCEHCQWEGSYRDCILKTPKEIASEVITEYINNNKA